MVKLIYLDGQYYQLVREIKVEQVMGNMEGLKAWRDIKSEVDDAVLYINPPFNLRRLDFIRRIKRKNVVALRELIFKKTSGENGFKNIEIFNYYTLKTNL